MADHPKMRSYRWFPSDYLGSETRLALELDERGAYRELLDWNYQEGSIPADPVVLAKFLSIPLPLFERIWKRVSVKFEPDPSEPGRLTNPRAAEVITEEAEYRRKAAEKGRKGAQKRWGGNRVPHRVPHADDADRVPHRLANAQPMASPPLPSSPEEELQADQVSHTVAHLPDARRGDSPQFALQPPTQNGKHSKAERDKRFNAWWQLWPNKQGKKPARKAFDKLVTSKAIFDELMRLTPLYQERQFRFRDPGKVPYPATFLNREPWDDGQDPPFEGGSAPEPRRQSRSAMVDSV